jgi:preprotein translocase subunit SecE
VSDTRGSTATPERGRSGSPASGDGHGLFARIGLFYRQVVAELRKVIWPTRRELITYTTVVLFFVAGLTAIVAVVDSLFGRVVLFVFGGGSG